MKKKLLTAVIIAAAFSAAACSSKAKEETTAAESASVPEDESAQAEGGSTAAEDENAAASDAADDEYMEDEGYLEGTVTAINGKNITIQDENGQSYVFDTSNAVLDPDYDILPGALVDVSYDGAKSDVTPANEVYVVMSLEQQADSLGKDPVLVGTVTDLTPSEITVTDPNGKPHVLSSSMAYVVASNPEELNVGAEVDVTYVGTLDEAEAGDTEDGSIPMPIATKIVLASARNSAEASQNIVVGTINYIDTETNTMMIDGDTMSFEFSCPPELINGLAEGNTVKVTYEGSLYNRIVTATSISPVNEVGTGR